MSAKASQLPVHQQHWWQAATLEERSHGIVDINAAIEGIDFDPEHANTKQQRWLKETGLLRAALT